MELRELVGPHLLSGVDMTSSGDANGIVFVLDGVAYQAMEDPSDGYRSYLGELSVVDADGVKNRFAAVPVLARMRDDDVLEVLDGGSGDIVLAIGTENADDYYPWFVGDFTPEHMSVNAEARREEG